MALLGRHGKVNWTYYGMKIDLHRVCEALDMPVLQTYYDAAESDTAEEQIYVAREGININILIADGGCINVLNYQIAKCVAHSILRASADVAKIFKYVRMMEKEGKLNEIGTPA